MADRSSRFDNDRSPNGRTFNAREMAVINKNQNPNRDVSRGVRMAVEPVTNPQQVREPNYQLKKATTQDVPSTIRKQEQSLMNCQLANDDVLEMWKSIQGIVENMDNTDPMFDKFLALGNYYQHGNFCEFQMGMYRSQETEQNLLDFKRMSGDGFVMDSFFRDVRNKIREQNPNLMMDIDEFEDDDDDMIVFDDFTDSEDEDDSGNDQDNLAEFLQIGGPLNLKSDSTVVKTWIDDCQNRHIEDKNHRMGLMAHNAANADNLEIIIREGGEELTTLIRKLFAEHEHAAYVRNASVLLKHMSTKMDFDDQMLRSAFEAIGMWVPGNGRKETFRLTESRETVLNLATVFTNLVDRNAVDEDKLSGFANKLTQKQKEAVSEFVQRVGDYDADEKYAEQLSLLDNIMN